MFLWVWGFLFLLNVLLWSTSCQGAVLTHFNFLPIHIPMTLTDSSILFLFGKGGSSILVFCSLCGAEGSFSWLADPVCSSFSVEAWVILQTLLLTVALTSLIFLYLKLSLCSCYFFSILFFSLSLAHLRGTVQPLLLNFF